MLYWCFSYWLTSLYNRLQFHPSHQNWFKCILLNGWVILHCVYVPQLSYPLVCLWASRLLTCPGYYKQCCDEHWGTCVSFNSGFLGVYAQQWNCWVIWQFYSSSLRNLHTVLHSGCTSLHSHQQCKTVPFFSSPSPTFIVCRLFDSRHSDWCEMVPHCGFDLHFSDNEWCWASFHVFVSHLYVSSEKCQFRSLAHFLIG